MRFVTLIALLVSAVVVQQCFADEPADARVYWVYEGGWFAKAKDDSWYELNEETHRRLGKPSQFREVKRTKEYVEIYDESRKVTARLSDTVVEVRWDKDGADAEFKLLYKGRWKKLVP